MDYYEQMVRKTYANERGRYGAFELSVCFAFPSDKTLSASDCVLEKRWNYSPVKVAQ